MASEGSVPAPDPSNEDRSPLTKRRRTTERPPADADGSLKPLQATSSTRRASASTMERSASPTDAADSIRLTKTGRVSKASKGQRVHNCDECGKTYTRAEHLRRHKQNHKPGAFPCDVPGCTRAFYREDLLTRHKVRHNDPLNPPSRRHSVADQDSPDPGERMIPFAPQPVATLPSNLALDTSTTQSPMSGSISPRASQQTDVHRSTERRYRDSAIFRSAEPLGAFFDNLSLSPKRGYLPLNQLPVGAPPLISVDTSSSPYFADETRWHESSPSRSPDGSTPGPSAHNGYIPQGQLPYLPTESSFPYTSDVSASRSPISASSSTQMPYWGHGLHSPTLAHSTPSSEMSYGNYSQNIMDPQLWMQSTGQLDFEVTRYCTEAAELATPILAPQSADFGSNLDAGDYDNERRYFDAYWRSVHPVWPVVHRPTFDTLTASPLLRASILALGAQATGDRTHVFNARILHERCMKVLKQRTIKNWHTFRVCDMQAVVLIEIYAIFKSRRPPLQLSKSFEVAYNILATAPAWQNYSEYGTSGLGGSIDEQCQQRLLAACYILDLQHAALFGRSKTSILSEHPGSLVFPQTQLVWDSSVDQTVDLYGYAATLMPAPYAFVYEAVAAASRLSSGQVQHDTFSSMLLLAYLADDRTRSANALEQDDQARAIQTTVEQAPQVLLAHHTFMLCQYSHIRDLLAVAGESWVMAEKLTSLSDYTASQDLTQEWATEGLTESSDVHNALTHALEILRIHHSCPRTGLLFQEWSVYLASIVIWARAYVTNRASRKLRVSVPSPIEPRTPAHELDRTIMTLVQRGAKSAISLREAKNVLMWTKLQIERVDVPHNSGLTNGALDVLGKLVMRGSEEGHWL